MLGGNTSISLTMAGDVLPAAGDVDLARAASADDTQARREVVDRLLDRVRATVRYLVSAASNDADDLVQLSLVEILRSLKTFRGKSRLETWADRITVRTCMRALRQRRRLEASQPMPGDVDQLGQQTEEPVPGREPARSQEQQVSRRQLRGRLAETMQKLSPQRRAVVVLRFVHGYSIKEIAQLTGAPPNTVRDRLQVGKRQLRQHVLRDPVLRHWAEVMD